MGSMHCRLYDENLVHHIILSTGMAVADFIRRNKNVDTDEICGFLEERIDSIIEETIEHLNNGDEYMDKDDSDDGEWSTSSEETPD